MELEEHINILKALRMPFKAPLIRIMYTIFEDHQKEIEAIGIDKLITMIYPPRPPRPAQLDESKAVISVEELIRKAQTEGYHVAGTRPQGRRPYGRRRPSPFYSYGETT